jgi:hypothetical protein
METQEIGGYSTKYDLQFGYADKPNLFIVNVPFLIHPIKS